MRSLINFKSLLLIIALAALGGCGGGGGGDNTPPPPVSITCVLGAVGTAGQIGCELG